ncbi:MAG: 2-amino-4-hydroxy-6-hydroxymethyldihydropteridine diphosphokinase [Magnetococcus sp. YQC-5]
MTPESPVHHRTPHPNRLAWIGLGGNLTRSPDLCEEAVQRLAQLVGMRLVAQSPFYQTQPFGPVLNQPWFINAVLIVETTWGSHALLRRLARIEASLGRNRQHEIRWGPRCLDLDLLFHGNRRIHTPSLILPHPRLHLRRFVLQPLRDVSPTWIHPVYGKTIDTLLQEVEDKCQITPWPGRRLETIHQAATHYPVG